MATGVMAPGLLLDYRAAFGLPDDDWRIRRVPRTLISLTNRPPSGNRPATTCRNPSACGSAIGEAADHQALNLPPEIAAKVAEHPCYSEDAQNYFARMHVAVAPACNIQCHYCNRKYDCANESRPGVTSAKLTPETAAERVIATARAMPNLSVVGIAGPGDALADYRHTFATLDILKPVLPDLTYCLSTNGLALPDHIDALVARGIHHVTVTLNALEPEIGARIYAWVYFDHRRLEGEDAARVLIERQLAGIDALVAAGILVKINSVMIPGINDAHLADVHAEVVRRGVFLHNVMPLISNPAHGTHYGLSGQRAPTASELSALRARLGGSAKVMRHCRQCRADAVGLLGDDCAEADSLAAAAPPVLSSDEAAPAVDPEPRRAYRAFVAAVRAERADSHVAAEQRLQTLAPAESIFVAVTSKGGDRVNAHFGHASEFRVYAVDRAGIRLDGIRRVDHYCQGGDGDDDRLEATIASLEGVDTVLTARIGSCPRDRLAAAGITVDERFAFEPIERAILGLLAARAAADPVAGASGGGRAA
jgi:nitrogen fixation protein NifB